MDTPDRKTYEKDIKLKLKELFGKIKIENYKSKVSATNLIFLDEKDETVAEIHSSFCSDRFCPLGAITALNLSIGCPRNKIYDILKEVGLFKAGYPTCIGRYPFPQTTSYPEGDVLSFYPTMDSEERFNELEYYIVNDIVPRMDNLLNHRIELINDILSQPNYYVNPPAMVIITLFLNAEEERIDEVLFSGKSRKIRGFDDKSIKPIMEIITKYFKR